MLAGEKWKNDVYSFYVSKNSIFFIKNLLIGNQSIDNIYNYNNNFYQIYFI